MFLRARDRLPTRAGWVLAIVALVLLAAMPPSTTTANAQLQSNALFRGDVACVFRPSSQRFYCDTGRDGGFAEYSVVFGAATDIPLLGDINGDGRDVACAYRPSTQQFFCDTARNGTPAEFVVLLG